MPGSVAASIKQDQARARPSPSQRQARGIRASHVHHARGLSLQDDRSVVPLDHNQQSGDGMWKTVHKEMFRGEQIRAGDRAMQSVQRGTLGARRIH